MWDFPGDNLNMSKHLAFLDHKLVAIYITCNGTTLHFTSVCFLFMFSFTLLQTQAYESPHISITVWAPLPLMPYSQTPFIILDYSSSIIY